LKGTSIFHQERCLITLGRWGLNNPGGGISRDLRSLTLLKDGLKFVKQVAKILKHKPKEKNMPFAIFKLSYNTPGETELVGGICGTGFFINDLTAVTARHVLNKKTFQPNPGFRYCQLWILLKNGMAIPLTRHSVFEFPEADLTVIKFPKQDLDVRCHTLSNTDPPQMTKVYAIGYAAIMPQVIGDWEQDLFVIRKADVQSAMCREEGYIVDHRVLDVEAKDVMLKGIHCFELSFGSRTGMSGGPVIDTQTSHIVGMLSIGLPADVPVKNRTFAISVREIRKRLQNID